MDEMLGNDLGFGRQLTAQNRLYLSTGLTPADVSQAVIGGTLYLTITQADGTRVTENIGAANQISSVNFSDGTSVGYGALASQINGTAGADNLTGTAGADQIDGFGGNDTLSGLGGNDRLYGGDGNDQLHGGNGADSLYGGAGTDYLFGGVGADLLDGGAGTADWAQYDQAAAAVRADLTDAASNTGEAAGDRYVGIENLSGSAFNDALRGNAGDNALWGHAGNDRIVGEAGNDALNGGAGADTLIGGTGNDTYTIDAGDTVIEEANAGIDLINSAVTYTLTANVEHLTLTGTTPINGTGNNLANRITGNAAANVLDGATGADTLIGGAGNDLYITDGGDTITEAADGGIDRVHSSASHVLAANVENLVLTGSAAINGTGNGLANSITGNAAANVLDGGAGADILIGGAGNDTYHIDSALDRITETATGGVDRIISLVTIDMTTREGAYANVEDLTLGGSAAIHGYGTAGANNLAGNGAANILHGRDGNDIITGGMGDDTIDGGAGIDAAMYTGSVSVTVDLNTGVATGHGTDQLRGIENVVAGSGSDTLTGGATANVLTGGAGADAINGLGGADRITGGAGRDLLNGGADAARDVFVFGAASESTIGAERDKIFNFVSGTDVIHLTGIDANTAAAGDQAFAFSGTTAAAHSVWYGRFNADLVVRGDTNGDGVADFEIQIVEINTLAAGDFML